MTGRFIPDAGHLVIEEKPQALLDAIVAFLMPEQNT
jgi:pimeloyl-ACP methyl ester carboxylesterase